RDIESVGELLDGPPTVFAAAAVVMVAAGHPVHVGSIDHVAIGVDERAIAAAIAAQLGVTMKFPTQKLEIFLAEGHTIIPHQGNLLFFGAGAGTGWLGRFRRYGGQLALAREGSGIEFGDDQIVVEGVHAAPETRADALDK